MTWRVGQRPGRRGHPPLAVAAAALAFLILGAGSRLAAELQPLGFDPTRDSATLLLASGTPHRWVAAATAAVTGLLVLVVAWSLPRLPRAAALVLTLAGAAFTVLALVPRGSDVGWSWPSGLVAAVGALSLALWPAFTEEPAPARRPDEPAPARRPDEPAPAGRPGDPAPAPAGVRTGLAVSGLLVALLTGAVLVGREVQAYGLLERVAVLAALGWLNVAAVRAWWMAGHRLGSRQMRQLLGLGVTTMACVCAGIVTTILAPVPASTANFSARVSLSPDPRDVSRVVIETVLGDVDLSFRGLAPGVRVQPQVRAEITEAIGAAGASIRSLQPTPAEQDAAIAAALTGLALRFAAGGLVAATAAVVARSAWRHRRPGWRTLAIATGSWLGAQAIVALAAFGTFAGATPEQINATGLLGTVRNRAGILDDLQARSAEVAPYLQNVIALSAALQERYQPAEIADGQVLRILLVSDIHAGNQYPLMASIIRSEDVDLVIDAGDLVNFGTPGEGTIADLYTGIESLGVPYLFVRGNHDAISPTDTAVLNRLAEIPNVILLQPTDSLYQEVDVAGITIAGFNDVRYWGDGGKGSAEKSQAPKQRWLASFAQRPAVDVVVSHEPWAVQGIPRAGVLINGHMHTAYREGNRLQAGTFTGGGPLTHFVPGQGGEELVGQPSAFDLLDFGATCRLTAVRRYQFTNIVEGRPAYDNVSLVNGAVVDTRPVDPLRTCAHSEPLRVVSVAPATPLRSP